MLKLKSILLTHVALPTCTHKARCLPLIALVLSQSFTLDAQPSATNQVLELDGKGSYVQLPPGIFKELTQATVEGWVKWDSFGRWSRFFDFGTTQPRRTDRGTPTVSEARAALRAGGNPRRRLVAF